MKLRKVLAAVSASAVALSAVAISASAVSVPEGCNSAGMFACLLSDDVNVPLFTDPTIVDDITSVSLTLKCKDKEFEKSVQNGEWYGGGFGFNSNSRGWDSHEWSIQDGVKELTLVPTETRYEYKISYTSDKPIFSSTDTYAQVWIQDWTSTASFSVVSFELLNKDGVDIRDYAAEAPAETEKPADTEAPVDTTDPVDTEEVYTEEVYTEEEYTEEEYDTAEVDEEDRKSVV